MRVSALRAILASVVMAASAHGVGLPVAKAQGAGSLGGYGGSSISSGSGMGSGGFIPYAGNFGGFMPARMGGGSLSFQPRPSATMGPIRTSFRLSATSDEMSAMGGGSGRIGGARSGMTSPLGTSGSAMGSVGGMGRRMTGLGGVGVMPPSLGYPFRQPPVFASPASGTGMSM